MEQDILICFSIFFIDITKEQMPIFNVCGGRNVFMTSMRRLSENHLGVLFTPPSLREMNLQATPPPEIRLNTQNKYLFF